MLSVAHIKHLLKTETADEASAAELSNETMALFKFYEAIPADEQVLAVVGGGTAALTYLYTQDIEPQYKHVVILGGRGYWGQVAHRLAQPLHIIALPHTPSEPFIDPAEHDEREGVTPYETRSAYTHSMDFQARLEQLEIATVQALHKKGIRVFIAPSAMVKKIDHPDPKIFSLELQTASTPIFANKVVVASGAGPARKLDKRLQASLLHSATASAGAGSTTSASPLVQDRVLSYTDILSPVSEKCRGKDVLIYGGGATAAWAMEVADVKAREKTWVARAGFELAISAGPRVNAIIKRTRPVQFTGNIIDITPVMTDGEQKLLIKVSPTGVAAADKTFLVDYLINCIGQEPYELGGLPEILSPAVKGELVPYLDRNFVTGKPEPCMLGWTNKEGNFLIIGAAQATYYDRDRPIDRAPAVSNFIPISGQVPITIGGVISSVCALTNYMPFSQDRATGQVTLTGLNAHIMNASQLAVYFTVCYPDALPSLINVAVMAFIGERIKTDFGLSPRQTLEFLASRFGHLPLPEPDLLSAGLLMPKAHAEPVPRALFAGSHVTFFAARAPVSEFRDAVMVLKDEDLTADVLLPGLEAPAARHAEEAAPTASVSQVTLSASS